MTLNDLTVNFEHLNREEILSDWRWLIGDTKLPILLSASGDAFVQDMESGSIFYLDTATAEIFEVAGDIKEFHTLLTDQEFVVNHFAVNMIGDLMSNGVILEPGKIYSYKKPPVLGGEYVLNNIELIDIEVHFAISGQIHNQVKNLPVGTKISDVTIE